MRRLILFAWGFLFDHNVSPLRNIPDIAVRHMVLQMLGWMWACAFSIALGSYTILAISVLGHVVLIAAATITVAIYTAASKRPEVFITHLGRSRDGEHV